MIFVTGDTHGNALGEMKRFNSKNFLEKKSLTKEDVVIIVGDFGFLWNNPPTPEEKYWLKWLNNQNFTTLFLDGNHENFDLLNDIPMKEKWGNFVGEVDTSIFHLRRGLPYLIQGKTFFCMGGARSTDKDYRVLGKSFWIQEEPDFIDYQVAIDSLEEIQFKCDYVLTHEAPRKTRAKFFPVNDEEKYPLLDFLDIVLDRMTFTHWYFGHYHEDKKVDEHFTCCYNKIYRVL